MKIYRCSCDYDHLPDRLELADQDDFVMFPMVSKRTFTSFTVYRPIGSNAAPGVGYKLDTDWCESGDYPGLECAWFVKIGD